MNKFGTPTIEQVAALRKFKAKYPGCWKSRLNQAWMNGVYDSDDDSMHLQQIRNELGPSWLARFKFSHPAI